LNREQFFSVEEAKALAENWRLEYNHHRPHSSLGNLTPEEFIRQKSGNFSTGMPVEAGLVNSGYSNM
jgi:putative transposase